MNYIRKLKQIRIIHSLKINFKNQNLKVGLDAEGSTEINILRKIYCFKH